jgi:uncharacterized protein with gpF-like domain
MPRNPLTAPSPQPITCAAVRPNAGIEAAYRKRLKAMVAEMNASILYWITAAYRASPPELAEDARPPPANLLIRRVRNLGKRWERKFAEAAPKLAAYFATSVAQRSDAVLKTILKDGGFTVSFNPTPAVNDVLAASIQANVALIKSIPSEHFTQIEGMVMRATQTGRDLATLTKELKQSFGVTERRAAFIAKDQINKTTATIVRARQEELGIEKAVWLHSGGGNHPRPEHVKWGREAKTYDVAKGMWSEVDQAWIWPGTAINCRCVSKSIVAGYNP